MENINKGKVSGPMKKHKTLANLKNESTISDIEEAEVDSYYISPRKTSLN